MRYNVGGRWRGDSQEEGLSYTHFECCQSAWTWSEATSGFGSLTGLFVIVGAHVCRLLGWKSSLMESVITSSYYYLGVIVKKAVQCKPRKDLL
jgi:hypothetical protein